MATPVADAIPLTGNLERDALVQGGQWQSGGGPTVLTYSFSIETELGIGWTPALRGAVRLALAEYSAVANISFQEIAPGSDVDFSPADLAFALTGDVLQQLTGGAIGLGFFPDPAAADVLLASIENTRDVYPNPEGDVYFDNAHAIFRHVAPGGAGMEVILHEIGHALGLKHPGDDGANGRPSAFLDVNKTLMDGGAVDFPFDSGHAATPLLLDVAAIQHVYGANMSWRTGDDVYRLRPDGAQRVIWDAGGIDTLDLSAATREVFLFMEEGTFVEAGLQSRVAIAYGVTIENAIGSRFGDVLFGNAAANRLEGGLGNDTYHAQADDIIVERANGGIDLLQPSVPFAVMPDHIERFIYHPDAGAADIVGNAGHNDITGNGFDNRIEGGAGNDSLSGGLSTTDNDTLVGGPGDDVYQTTFINTPEIIELRGEGNDTWRVSFSATLPDHVENLILAGAGDASATGNNQANRIVGSAGHNVLDGRGGADTLEGGLGNDTYVLGAGDVVIDTGGRDMAFSEITLALGHLLEDITLLPLAGNAWVAGTTAVNHLVGNDGANVLDGGSGNDTLEGGRGDDTLLGGAGNDHLDGGRGVDRMEGGAGNDYFIVSATRDEVVELAGGGTDSVRIEAARYTLPANVENAVLVRDLGSVVTGNALANRFIFDRLAGVDRILGFESGKDRLLLDDSVFTLGTAALSYDEPSGALYYDGVQLAWLGGSGDPSDAAAADFGLV